MRPQNKKSYINISHLSNSVSITVKEHQNTQLKSQANTQRKLFSSRPSSQQSDYDGKGSERKENRRNESNRMTKRGSLKIDVKEKSELSLEGFVIPKR